MRPPVAIVAALLFICLVGLVTWHALYPGNDPKGVRYTLWKAGFGTMNPDLAVGAMVGDRYRERLVIGKTKEQLQSRFGVLRGLEDVSPYLRACYQEARAGEEVLFIRRSPWMVVFGAGVAKELVLCKG